MSRVRSFIRLLASGTLLTVSACSEAPIAPSAAMQAPDAPDLGLLTWYYLPKGAQWALIFDSQYGDGSLRARVYHYPTSPGTPDPVGTVDRPNKVEGSGSFSISGTKLSGTLTPISAVGDGTCVPWGLPCDPASPWHQPHYYNGVLTIVPEAATVTGRAVVNRKATNFVLELHSTQYPDRSSIRDWATLRFCSDLAVPTTCGATYTFHGQLHHEPT